MKNPLPILMLFLLLYPTPEIMAQAHIKGRVTDAETKEPLAFANVTTPGTQQGIMTDIDGKFSLRIQSREDSFLVTYVGYQQKKIKIRGENNYYLIKLVPEEFNLSEITVVPGKNPAHRIIKKAVENREQNNPEAEDAFILSTYNKMVVKPDDEYLRLDTAALDSAQRKIMDDFSDKNLFIIETVSRRFFEAPDKVKEDVLHTQVSGLRNPFFFLLASQLQSFTFYRDIIHIGGMRMVNPISKGSTKKYWFRIEDTTFVNGPQDTVFTISFRKRGDRSFSGMQGVIQIGTQDFAIRSVMAQPSKKTLKPDQPDSTTASVTVSAGPSDPFDIKIQQKYEKIDGKKWFPMQLNTDILLYNISLAGIPVKVEGRTYVQDVEIKNNIKNSIFDENYLVMDEKAAVRNDSMIGIYRVDTLTAKERNTYHFIDSLSQAYDIEKTINTYRILMNGYIPWGAFNFPLDKFIGYNVHEGWRLGAGISTNYRFSKVVKPSAYFRWSPRDHSWKYGGEITLKLWDENDLFVKAKYHDDVRELGALPDYDHKGLLYRYNLRDFLISRMDREELMQGSLKFRVAKYAEVEPGLRHRTIGFYDNYQFGSKNDRSVIGIDGFSSTEFFVKLRYAFREKYIKSIFGKESLGSKYPIVWMNYTHGTDIFNGQLSFQKYDMQLQKSFHTKYTGSTSLLVRAGAASANIPLSLQYSGFGSHQGFGIACPGTFNTMKVNEFAANRFTSIHLEHDFKKHLFRSKYFQPSIMLTSSAIWGSWDNQEQHFNLSYKTLEKGYFESGLLIRNIIKGSFAGTGVGFYYRYGPYSLESFKKNLTIKLVVALGI